MSGSITIIGGHTGNTLTGLVTTPVDFSASVTSALQTLLSATAPGLSASVLGGEAFLNNINVVDGGVGPVGPNSSGLPGLLELTNTYGNGSVLGGTVSGSTAVPANYSTLIVQAPGSETISGNGSANFLALFGNQSSVNFNTGGGSGSVYAAGPGDFVNISGNTWSVVASGSDTVNSLANSTSITTSGSNNVVGLFAASSTVNAGGNNDLVETYNAGSNVVVSVTGSNENILVNGGADTVYAGAGSSGTNAFFELSGGSLYFINNSTVAASVTGAVNGAIGGSVTVNGSVGGGSYNGGPGGNNSLIGGSGLVTLYAAGFDNLLSVTGAGTGLNGNVLGVGSSSNTTLVASASTTNNTFFGGLTGSTTITSFGSGNQNFFVGAGDQEHITGSTTSGAVNNYYFNQDTTGSGTDVITNFKYGSDHIYINHIGPYSGVSIAGISANLGTGGGSLVQLNDGTTIKLYGQTFTQQEIATLVGGTQI